MSEEFKQARLRRDRNYDGIFYFGVSTTGIFCRPSCPSPTAKEENTTYFRTMFEPMEQGYRPCRRCRPDLSTEYGRGITRSASLVGTGLTLIHNGFLTDGSVQDLAAELGVSDRHLRKLFMEIVGVPPVKVGQYHKGIFAKKMLVSSSRPVTDIAFAAGFGSVRRFNEVFKKMFNQTPSEVRSDYPNITGPDEDVSLLLKYDQDFSFGRILSFLRPRVLKGVETVSDTEYTRTFRTQKAEGFFRVEDIPEESALKLSIRCSDVRCCMEIHSRVRRMFDLDTDFTTINERFRKDARLRRGLENNHVPRLPMAFDPFEFTVRAVLGQQITVKAASTLAARVAEQCGKACPEDFPEGLRFFFPNHEELPKSLDVQGVTRTRQATINNIARGISDKTFSLRPDQPFERFHAEFSALKGIGDWTVNYVAMRGLGMIDSFPAGDLGIIKALSPEGTKLSKKHILNIAEKWRPYRAYAALCLWNSVNSGG